MVHLRMLDEAAAHDFHFDARQMPLNVMDAHFRSFTHQVVPRLVEQGIAVLGMKPLAEGYVLRTGVVTPIEALHYALNLPTSVVINGCDSIERVNQALEAARTFRPMTAEQTAALLAKTQTAALTGKYEPFKTTSDFDGTAGSSYAFCDGVAKRIGAKASRLLRTRCDPRLPNSIKRVISKTYRERLALPSPVKSQFRILGVGLKWGC